MIELFGLLMLLIVGGVLLGLAVLCFKLLFLLFKVALIPVKIGFKLVIGLLGLVLVGGLLLVFGPVAAVVLFALFLPVLILGGLLWGAVALVT
jgi:hypothetical protein